MDLGIRNKVALICGASRGLGRAVAEELAAEGASLILCARDAARLEDARGQIEKEHGVAAVGVAADVGAPDAANRVVRQGLERFGRVDILVTNEGGPPAGTLETLTREQWNRAIHTTLMSVYELSQLVLPGMKERRWGRILNITSVTTKQPIANLLLSNTLRPAVTGFARSLSDEVAAFGVTVNTILPGFTRTERAATVAGALGEKEGISATEIERRWESAIPMRRMADPREFAALAAFLVSERASYITGASYAVDGGWTRSLF